MQKNLEFNLNVWKWHDVYADAVLFLTCKTYLSSCAMSFLDSKKISWHVQNFVPNKWFPCTLILDEETKKSSIFVNTVALRDISTESKQFAESIENMFSKLKVERKKSICGFACNRIQNYAWVEMLPCVRWSNLFQNLFPTLVIFSILNNWTISWRVKKHCPQTKDSFLICFSKGKNEYFLPASKHEEWIWRILVKSIYARNCLRLK